MLAFLAVIGTICVVASPDLLNSLTSLNQTKSGSRRNLSEQNGLYQVFQISTQFKNQFNLVGLPDEKVRDLKDRIQLLQGFPSERITLLLGSDELQDFESVAGLKS